MSESYKTGGTTGQRKREKVALQVAGGLEDQRHF